MKILVTGAAGFIGYHVCKRLLLSGHTVVGLDNINNYYDVNLKYARLNELGISRDKASEWRQTASTTKPNNFSFVRMDVQDRDALPKLFEQSNFEVVCHLAAQAGVRYSIENPETYIDSNIDGYLNILECCRHYAIKHFVYASSSSVYGLNKKIPFSVHDRVDFPISLYAATKKSNELMAHTYSHLYDIPTTGLRFFTVYGPWGRPDMAIYLFTEAIHKNNAINVFNEGNMLRDFTYIDDIIEGVIRILERPMSPRKKNNTTYKIYNIGNTKAVALLDFIKEIEYNLEKKATINFMPLQPGDVIQTWANVDNLMRDYDYSPKISVEEGVKQFVDWYVNYQNKVY